MRRSHRNTHLFQLYFYLIAAGNPALAVADSGFYSGACNNTIAGIFANGSDPSIFIDISDPSNLIISYKGCLEHCGSGTGWYPDSGPRLIDWLLPIILLIFNMQFAPIGWNQFWLIARLLGDPIDSTWSLLAAFDRWKRGLSKAKRVCKDPIEIKCLAIIIASIEELLTSLDDDTLREICASSRDRIRRTGSLLAENRRNEILRTLLAVALYVFQVLAVFIPAVGAASSPSGGKVGTAMLLSWIFCVVLLNNAVGGLGSIRSCQQIIADFLEPLKLVHDPGLYTERASKLNLNFIGIQKETKTSYQASMAWSGAIYCYCPRKKPLRASGWKLAVIAVLPVSIAFGTAFGVLDTGPTYFSCRHIFIILAFVSWIFSAIVTTILSRLPFITGKYLWYIILIKDISIGSPIVLLIVLSSCGLWNTCYCWGGVLVHGKEVGISLSPSKIFNLNDNVIYPAMVGTCLALHTCIFGIMLWVGWSGFRTMYWTEKEKRAASGTQVYPAASSSATELNVMESQPNDEITQAKEDNPYAIDQSQKSSNITITPVTPETKH